ncbi:MAG: hypothetical protein ACLFQ6_00600 [Candidatus Sumerlaeia bacterium]
MAKAKKVKTENSELEGEHITSGKKLADGYDLAIGKLDKQLLMHSPMGIRVDFNITQGELKLWISPQAKKSVDAYLRNFSNRDDHTSIFDQIRFPGLDPADFQSVDYDPFHSVLHYKNADIHVAPLVDIPGVLLWAESEEEDFIVDIKGDKQDRPDRRDEDCFTLRHPDRGLDFEFAAVAGAGDGVFQHQRHIDHGRSTYARIALAPGQPLIIGGELCWERPREIFEAIITQAPEGLVEMNEEAVSTATDHATIVFRDREDWQRQYDLNRRVLYSAQDHGGWIPAAFRALYYLCWHFDGAITSAFIGQTGWPEYLERWTNFEIPNPTETPGPVPGKFYGQLVTPRISKQEEWGYYCAVWSAFTYWTQTGSREFAEEPYIEYLMETLDWLERHAWDEEKGAFGIYYRGENPFKGTYDDGFDEAVGKPMNMSAPSLNGKAIRRMYNFEANLFAYNFYHMLAAMLDEPLSGQMLEKVRAIGEFLRHCHEGGFSAECLMEDGSWERNLEPGRWSPGCFFAPDYRWMPEILRAHPKSRIEDVRKGTERFVHHVLINYVMRDPALMGSAEFEEFMDIFLPQCMADTPYLQMPGSVIENVNCEAGSYHDNRPQIFATGLMQATFMAQGVRRQPFGLAVRANPYIREVKQYGYQGNNLSFVFEGKGDVKSLWIDDRELPATLQLPEQWLRKNSTITTKMGKSLKACRWMASSVRLLNVEKNETAVTYSIEAFGCNSISFSAKPKNITLKKGNQKIESSIKEAEGWHYLRFEGRGKFVLKIE